MTKSTRDIPSTEGQTIADRLKTARENAGMTRKALATATGIPASTLEKYERGDMDPNTTRLQTICEHLNVAVNWVLYGSQSTVVSKGNPVAGNEPSAKIAEFPKTAETQASAHVAENFSDTSKFTPPANENDGDELSTEQHAEALLQELDKMRKQGFHGTQRRAVVLIDATRTALKQLEPEALWKLAERRGLYPDNECLTLDDILDLFSTDVDEAQQYCGNVEERILDTAILGVDLYSINRDRLLHVADYYAKENDLEKPAMGGFSWGHYKDFCPVIRPFLWNKALSASGFDFSDTELFPRRSDEGENKLWFE